MSSCITDALVGCSTHLKYANTSTPRVDRIHMRVVYVTDKAKQSNIAVLPVCTGRKDFKQIKKCDAQNVFPWTTKVLKASRSVVVKEGH